MRLQVVVGRWAAAAAAVGVLLAGCARTPAPAAVVQQPAEVRSVEVLAPVADAGMPVALARGILPDGCARLGEAVVSPGGRLIVVILPAYSSGKSRAECGGPAAFERIIPLGGGLEPGIITVSINGVSTTFEVAEKASAPLKTVAAPLETMAAPVEIPAAGAEGEDQPVVEQQPTAVPEASAEPVVEEQPKPTAAAAEAEAAEAEVAGAGAAGAEGCEDKAAFFADVSVPDGSIFSPGEAFTKIWRIRNAGSCTWKDYALVFQDGDLMSASNPFAIRGEVGPGETVDISLSLTAPQKPGAYYSDWLLSSPGGKVFGLGNPAVGLLWTKVGVRSPALEASVTVCAYQDDGDVEAEILRLINAERQERGLAPLAQVAAISAAAREHSRDMACKDFVEHYGTDGSTWYTRIKAQGVAYRAAYENIYAGSPLYGGTPEAAVTWWMNSQVHRDNILNPKVRQIGVGYALYDGSKYKGYYTLNFVEP